MNLRFHNFSEPLLQLVFLFIELIADVFHSELMALRLRVLSSTLYQAIRWRTIRDMRENANSHTVMAFSVLLKITTEQFKRSFKFNKYLYLLLTNLVTTYLEGTRMVRCEICFCCFCMYGSSTEHCECAPVKAFVENAKQHLLVTGAGAIALCVKSSGQLWFLKGGV